MKSNLRKVIAAVMALVMCLCLTACSGANYTENNTEYVIGVSGPLTGAAAVYGVAVQNSAQMAVDEINAVIRKEMTYDDFKWQKDNNIIIKNRKRAEGLHKVLYQCPACKTEYKMNTKGIHLFCEECGKKWEMTTLGELKALNGETEFSHIPDWYEWERECVRQEILDGTYHFEDDVHVHSSVISMFP
mgnify:CR=1 FL=1